MMRNFDLMENHFTRLKIDSTKYDESSKEVKKMEKIKASHHPQQRSKSLGVHERNCLRSVLRDIASDTSPTNKKAVHFADNNGLALVNVHKFIPSSDDLECLDSATKKRNLFWRSGQMSTEPDSQSRPNCFSSLMDVFGLVLGFSQPSLDPGFLERLKISKVCLENASLHDRSITGIIKVCNLSFAKDVAVRFTNDSWLSFAEIPCNYIPSSTHAETDQFSFTLNLTKKQKTLQFAIRYQVNGQEFWDNNHGKNYVVFSTG